MLRQHSQYDSRLGFSFRVLVGVRLGLEFRVMRLRVRVDFIRIRVNRAGVRKLKL